MTIETFKHKIKKRSRFADILNYLTCSAFIVIGLYFLYKVLNYDFNPLYGNGQYLVVLVSLIPLVFGFYGFWRIPKDYEVTCIYSTKSIEEKEKIIYEYFSTLKVVSKSLGTSFIECRYRNIFLNKVDLKIFIDEEKILFNAQGVDQSGSKGIFDFGLTNRATKKIKKYINACL